MTTPHSGPAAAASAAPLVDRAVARSDGLPQALVILLGAPATVVVIAGIQAIAWLIGPAFMALIVVIAKAMLVDVDPRARWADALLRASAKEPDPATPKPRRRRPGSAAPAAAPI